MTVSRQEEELREAAFRGDVENLRRLLASGVNLETRDDEGQTALLNAVQGPNPEAVKVLMQAGADREARDGESATPLMWAVRSAFEEHYDRALAVVNLLLDSGADVNAKTDSGATALIYAVTHGHSELAELLIKAGADVNVVTSAGWSALEYATEYCVRDGEVLEVLAAAGARSMLRGSAG